MTTSKAERLIEAFGGVRALARELGIDPSVVSRWAHEGKRGKAGHVPTHYNNAVVEAAERAGVAAELVAECLDPHVCPCCGQNLEPGQVAREPGR